MGHTPATAPNNDGHTQISPSPLPHTARSASFSAPTKKARPCSKASIGCVAVRGMQGVCVVCLCVVCHAPCAMYAFRVQGQHVCVWYITRHVACMHSGSKDSMFVCGMSRAMWHACIQGPRASCLTRHVPCAMPGSNVPRVAAVAAAVHIRC